MTFEELVDQAIEMVRRRGQVSYRMLKRQFDIDDEVLEDMVAVVIRNSSLCKPGRSQVYLRAKGAYKQR